MWITKDDRTFDSPLPLNTVCCLCLCTHHFPFGAELMRKNSKAMKVWLWSVIHVWQVLRGPWQYSQPHLGAVTETQDCDANEACTTECIFQPKAPHTWVKGIFLGFTISYSWYTQQNSSQGQLFYSLPSYVFLNSKWLLPTMTLIFPIHITAAELY